MVHRNTLVVLLFFLSIYTNSVTDNQDFYLLAAICIIQVHVAISQMKEPSMTASLLMRQIGIHCHIIASHAYTHIHMHACMCVVIIIRM